MMKCFVIGREEVLTKSNTEIVNEISASLESENTAEKAEPAKVEEKKVAFAVNVIPAELQKAVSNVSSIVTDNHEKQYLRMVEVGTEKGDTLTLTARHISSYAMTITEKILADVQLASDKPFFVSAKSLEMATSCMSGGGNINLQYDGASLIFKTDIRKSKCQSPATDDMKCPETVKKYLPKLDQGKIFSLNIADFKTLIKKVIPAAAMNKSSKYACVYVEVAGTKITLTATDGNQFATASGDILDVPSEGKFLIPAGTLKFFCKTANEGKVKICYTDTAISFKFGDIEITSNLFKNENYPIEQIKKLIPTELKASAIVDKSALQNALKLVALTATDERKTIKFSFVQNTGLILES